MKVSLIHECRRASVWLWKGVQLARVGLVAPVLEGMSGSAAWLPTANEQPLPPMNVGKLVEDPLPCALMIIPHMDTPPDLTAMELVIQALALPGPPRRRAIALELVGTAMGRALLVRVADPIALDHVERQIQARYAQCEIHRVAADNDPLVLRPNETTSARELQPSGPAYLSLRTWAPPRGGRSDPQRGVDPLLGLLAALGSLPAGMRAMTQLVLSPAPDQWSQGQERDADKYSLPSRRIEAVSRDRAEQNGTGGSPLLLILLVVLIGGLVLFKGSILGWVTGVGWHPLGSLGPMGVATPTPGPHPSPSPIPPKTPTVLPSAPVDLFGHIDLLTIGKIVLIIVGFILIAAMWWQRRRNGAHRQPVYDPQEIAQKTQQPAYRIRLRLFVISAEGVTRSEQRYWYDQREAILDHLAAAYRQYHRAGGSSFITRHLAPQWSRALLPEGPGWPGDQLRQRTRWVRGVPHSVFILSLTEIASLWHLPNAIDLPEIGWMRDRTRAKTLLAPRPVIARANAYGRPPHILGYSQQGGTQSPVYLPADILRRHLLAVAKTGKGKSTLLFHLAQLFLESDPVDLNPLDETSDIQTTLLLPGLVLIDPHGDLAQNLLGVIPADRRADVIFLDLADTEFPVGLNPLDASMGRDRDKAAENLMMIFKHIWKDSWGSRMGNVFANAIKTLFEANEVLLQKHKINPDEQYTLLDVSPLLSLDDQFREEVIQQIHDQGLIRWWRSDFKQLGPRLHVDAVNPVLTKVEIFASSRVASRIVGQPATTLDFARIVREGKILIINTARGSVGEETAALIGSTILGLIRTTLEEQARIQRGSRRRMLVLVDEFQTMSGADYGMMTAELRKYGATFAFATQSLAMLDVVDRELRKTVMSNIDNLFAFGMSADDAKILVPELDDAVTEGDLINLSNLTCYAKLTLEGDRLPTFSMRLTLPDRGENALRDKLQAQSRKEIALHSRLEIDAFLAYTAKKRMPIIRIHDENPPVTSVPVQKTPPMGDPTRTPWRADQPKDWPIQPPPSPLQSGNAPASGKNKGKHKHPSRGNTNAGKPPEAQS